MFKVVPARFNDVVRGLGGLGKLVHRQIGTQDVTGQVVDLGARLTAAQTSAARLQQLLASSGSVADLLSVEQQLTTRDGEVDSLSGELDALRAQVDLATITLDVSALPRPSAARARTTPPRLHARTARRPRRIRRHRAGRRSRGRAGAPLRARRVFSPWPVGGSCGAAPRPRRRLTPSARRADTPAHLRRVSVAPVIRRCIFPNGTTERSGGGNRNGRGNHQCGARVADRRRARRRRAGAAAP